ncbi:MAG: hypothetical protein K1X65_19400 [Caldilineales bacterium]|nr:hypothetical protein [Caldilineales bacterium]MCW5858920.1 PD40 domain-containing protein [Caldilineales bacterium]
MKHLHLFYRLLALALSALVVLVAASLAEAAPPAPAAGVAESSFWLAYYAGPRGSHDIFLVSADGRSKRQLTGPNRFDEAEPAWRPDGRAVAYESNELDDYDIWLAAEGAAPIMLIGTSEDELEPDWAPDGRAIVFVQGPFVDTMGVLTIAEEEVAELLPLAEGALYGRSPAWSPDGSQIAYMALQDGHWQIFVYDFRFDAAEQASFCSQHCRYPSWSPDGRFLFYHAANGGLQPLTIWRTPADSVGSGVDARVEVLKGQAPGRPDQAADGRLAFNGPNDLFLLPAGGAGRKLIPHTRGGIAPDWSPPLASPPKLGRAIDLTPPPTPARYFDLIWVPGCNPRRPVVALALPGQGGCTPGVETWDLDAFADELRALGLIGRREWLVAVPLGGKANQGLVIRETGNSRKGWIRIGGGSPGSVWRTPYSQATQVGNRCKLRIDYTWECR